jgi:hypothetical protein
MPYHTSVGACANPFFVVSHMTQACTHTHSLAPSTTLSLSPFRQERALHPSDSDSLLYGPSQDTHTLSCSTVLPTESVPRSLPLPPHRFHPRTASHARPRPTTPDHALYRCCAHLIFLVNVRGMRMEVTPQLCDVAFKGQETGRVVRLPSFHRCEWDERERGKNVNRAYVVIRVRMCVSLRMRGRGRDRKEEQTS